MSPLRLAVLQSFRSFTRRHEAEVDRLYCDHKGLPTFGLGQLVRTPTDTLPIPWRRPDGSLATDAEKLADWHRVHDYPGASELSLRIPVGPTTLRVSPEDLTRLFEARRDANALALARRFSSFPGWPAPAQFAVMSLAWAAGASFDFPRCAAALARGDFLEAAVECQINEVKTKGVAARNDVTRWLLLDAYDCVRSGGDPDELALVEPPRANVAARLAGALLRDTIPAPAPTEPQAEVVEGAAEAHASAQLLDRQALEDWARDGWRERDKGLLILRGPVNLGVSAPPDLTKDRLMLIRRITLFVASLALAVLPTVAHASNAPITLDAPCQVS